MLVSKKRLQIDKLIFVYVERNYVAFQSLCLHIYQASK